VLNESSRAEKRVNFGGGKWKEASKGQEQEKMKI
jgi:hypothetical protein